MMQRIQTIYLFLVAIVTSVLFFIPVAEFKYNDHILQLKATGIDGPEEVLQLMNVNTLPMLGALVLIILLALVSIFIFKKRLLQIKINKFNILMNCIFIALVYYFYIDKLTDAFEFVKQASLIKLAFPAVNMLLLFLANKAIRKDEKMVRAADRLR